ncbi:hypothetical protein D3C86_1422820 [compost metagenome]
MHKYWISRCPWCYSTIHLSSCQPTTFPIVFIHQQFMCSDRIQSFSALQFNSFSLFRIHFQKYRSLVPVVYLGCISGIGLPMCSLITIGIVHRVIKSIIGFKVYSAWFFHDFKTSFYRTLLFNHTQNFIYNPVYFERLAPLVYNT